MITREIFVRNSLTFALQGVFVSLVGGLLAIICLDTAKPIRWLVALGIVWLSPLLFLLSDEQWIIGNEIWWGQIGALLTWVLGSFAAIFLGALSGRKFLRRKGSVVGETNSY
jgi:hypothetical protein